MQYTVLAMQTLTSTHSHAWWSTCLSRQIYNSTLLILMIVFSMHSAYFTPYSQAHTLLNCLFLDLHILFILSLSTYDQSVRTALPRSMHKSNNRLANTIYNFLHLATSRQESSLHFRPSTYSPLSCRTSFSLSRSSLAFQRVARFHFRPCEV